MSPPGRLVLLLVAAWTGASGVARAADVAPVASVASPVSPAASGVKGFAVEGDHGILDELRVGALLRAGARATRRTTPRQDEIGVVAPTRAMVSVDAIFRQDVTARVAAAWNGVLGGGAEERPRTGKDRRVSLEEAFLEGRNLGDTPLWARLGRQPIARGAGMLLGEDLPGQRLTHDAALVAWETPTIVLQGYWERLRRRGLPGIDLGAFDGRIDSGGLYLTKRFHEEVGLDAYVIHLRDRSPRDAPEDRTTFGTRLFGRIADLVDYSFELAGQLGSRGDLVDAGSKKIAAYAGEGEISLDLRRLPLAPRITAHAALASGNKNPHGGQDTTFDPLYEDAHGRFGLTDLLVLENLRALGVRVAVRPSDSVLLELSAHALWVDEPADALAPRFLARRGRSSPSRELGHELSGRVLVDPLDYLTIEAGGGALLPGSYARAHLEGASVLSRAYFLVELRF